MRALLPIVIVVLAACSAAEPRPEPADAGSTSTSSRAVPQEWTTCNADPECTLVGAACCPCSADDYVAVHERFATQARQKYTCKKKVKCPPQDCPPIDARCVSGQCRSVERGS